MTDLRKAARDKPCMIRGHGCSFDNEETTLAHLNGGGMGMKHRDILGAWACHWCHNWVDRRIKLDNPADALQAQLHHYRGILRTIDALVEQGVIEV